MPTRERAQLLPQASPGASAFLSSVPSLPELSPPTAEMRMGLHRWLLLPLQNSIPTGPCVCSTTSHAPALSSHHLLTCRNEGMLGRLHDDLRQTLRDMATTAGLMAKEEPPRVSLDSAKAVWTFSSMTSTLNSPSSRMCASSRST